MKKIFNFFKKNNKIEFVCLLKDVNPDILYPPMKASEMPLPNWYKQRAKVFKNQIETAKCPFKIHPAIGDIIRCPGIKDLMNSGYTVRMWADFYIDLPKNHPASAKELQYGWGRNLQNLPELSQFCGVSSHHHSQFPNIFNKARTYPLIIKLNFPWKVKAPRGVAFYMLPEYYSDNDNFAITPGVFDTTYTNQVICNLQIFMQEGRLIIPAGTPMCKLIPFYKNENFNTSITNIKDSGTQVITEQIHTLRSFNNNYETLTRERSTMFDLFTD